MPVPIANKIVHGVLPFDLSELEDHLDKIQVVLGPCWTSEPAKRPTMVYIVQLLSRF